MTLTNWVRLNNAPLLLPRASAVQWNDYVFVLASDGTALLYHAKLKLWSMLPKCPYHLKENVPLVNYEGKILAVSNRSQICAFDAPTSSWKEESGPTVEEIIHMAVNHDTLHVYAWVTKSTGYMFGKQGKAALFTLTTEGWEEHDIYIQRYASKLLLTSKHIFVETANSKGIYCQKFKKTSESEAESDDTPIEPPKEIAPPPYKAFTLHVLKDTLLSFGGHDEDNQPTSDVLRYNPDTDTWESAGYMRSARYNVAVVTVQQDTTTEVYVLGGEFGSTKLKMKPKLYVQTQACTRTHNIMHAFVSTQAQATRKSTQAQQAPADWDCSTSIVEKCTLSD